MSKRDAKRTFGPKEELIIEQELEKLMRRSSLAQDVLPAEDVKILEMLLKAKKMVLEREDVKEPEIPKDVTDSLEVEELLKLAEGASEDVPN